MKINWPLLAVITWFLAFGTGVWADMPDPFNLTNILAFLAFATGVWADMPNPINISNALTFFAFVAFFVYYRGIQKKKNEL